MPFLTGPALWLIVMLLCTNGIAGVMWYVKDADAERYKEAVTACAAKHEAFVAQTKATGQIAAEKVKAKESEDARIAEQTAQGWAAALDVVRRDADRRLRQYANGSAGSRPVSKASADSVRIDDPAQSALPPAERILADCAEDTLKLVWLQHHIRITNPGEQQK
jgi:hypothetical protein